MIVIGVPPGVVPPVFPATDFSIVSAGFGDSDGVGLGDVEGVSLGDADGLADADGEGDADGEVLGEGGGGSEAWTSGDPDGDADGLGAATSEGLDDGDPIGDGSTEAEAGGSVGSAAAAIGARPNCRRREQTRSVPHVSVVSRLARALIERQSPRLAIPVSLQPGQSIGAVLLSSVGAQDAEPPA
jgi:hypothetical protein